MIENEIKNLNISCEEIIALEAAEENSRMRGPVIIKCK
ncbi:hypothetical protein CLROS_045760 (plasmid) [Clostridium felsineum]|uniref:Uncharacterized protein n=1 Tax=Clostridium felsineum TaxID=36839 RepID=A0A1S8LZS5_9CLOT|nr:hypothetical protein CLROS_045760 [Clostridium felsineum]URZ13846.1 hypothetical protein CROST_046240 [Clostridium felsineum]URZ18620.1 hypothetical protein CLFE_047080 [Clostridium felsineum DSM 794]